MAQTLAHCASLYVPFINTGQTVLAPLTKLLMKSVRKCLLGGKAHLWCQAILKQILVLSVFMQWPCGTPKASELCCPHLKNKNQNSYLARPWELKIICEQPPEKSSPHWALRIFIIEEEMAWANFPFSSCSFKDKQTLAGSPSRGPGRGTLLSLWFQVINTSRQLSSWTALETYAKEYWL